MSVDLRELPGADLVLPGVDDLCNGESFTVGALLIAIASTRLSTAGLAFPKANLASEPELCLYDLLAAERPDAYPYYNALLDSLSSFCQALEQVRRAGAYV